jgi:hypothetical protein
VLSEAGAGRRYSEGVQPHPDASAKEALIPPGSEQQTQNSIEGWIVLAAPFRGTIATFTDRNIPQRGSSAPGISQKMVYNIAGPLHPAQKYIIHGVARDIVPDDEVRPVH